MAKPWKNPGLSLGVRCNLFAKHEMDRGVRAAPYGQPNTSPDIEEYLAPCVRDLDGDEELDLLGLKEGNWCAASASYCMQECLLPGEIAPHKYRAGVVEIVADARALGLYHDVEEVRSGAWAPSTGDLVIWDRSKPERPETGWWRHVNRLVRRTPLGQITTIGGNENRRWQLTDKAPKSLNNDKLLGFVSYFQKPKSVQVDASIRDRDSALVASFIRAQLNERKIGGIA